jgi:hypothetical protein
MDDLSAMIPLRLCELAITSIRVDQLRAPAPLVLARLRKVAM